jgi:predicted metal-dependent peptidase
VSVSFDAGGDQDLLKIAAARVIACDKMPYLATALFAMVPVKVEGLGTLASDDKWRLYWDPTKIREWSVEQLAGVLLHEVNHCIRGHATRFNTLGEPHNRHMIFNVAGDSLINVDLRDERIPLPEGCVYVEQIENATREMSAEQIYRLLIEQAEKSCTCGSSGNSGDQSSNENNESGDSGSQESGGNDSSSSEESKGEEENSEKDSNSNGSQDSNSGGKNTDPNCPVHGKCNCSPNGEGEPCGHSGEPQVGENGIPQGWDCGAAADGVKRGYEQEGDKVDAGVDEDRADLIRQQVAVEITNHAKNRGTVPAGLSRWAKDILEPIVDWRRELASIIRRTFANVAGLRDYSYRRPSRRQAAMRGTGQGVILPAMRQPNPPTVSIVIDTSGSMSDDMLSWALSETQGVLRSLGASARDVKVFSCDASSSKAQRIRNVAQIELSGGGGTDMRVGIEAAMRENPKPDAVVVVSDGFTPWPNEPLKGATLIVALTDESTTDSVPSWARKVSVKRD